jgi:hypothetical protein
LLDPQNGLPYAARAALVTRLGLPTKWLEAPSSATNAAATVEEPVSTNSIPTNAAAAPLP